MRAPGPIRSACVTAIVLAVPLLWFFGFFGGGDAGRGEIRGVYLLTLVSYVVLYLMGWTKGRAIFLAGVLLAFASWATFEVADSNSNIVPVPERALHVERLQQLRVVPAAVLRHPGRRHGRDRDRGDVHRPGVPRRRRRPRPQAL